MPASRAYLRAGSRKGNSTLIIYGVGFIVIAKVRATYDAKMVDRREIGKMGKMVQN